MDRRYLRYCVDGSLFYDAPGARSAPGESDGDFTRAVTRPAGWRESCDGAWRGLVPGDAALREQGWKVHVSATLESAERVLDVVAAFCVGTGTAFKHLPSRRALLIRNAKYADRSGSGKFMTIYSRDDDHLADILAQLEPRLAGELGPYILTDLRIGDGPLYVRYGGFVPQWVQHDGRPVPAIRRPDGTLTADPRAPRFQVPEWVDLPACLVPHQRARQSGGSRFPYEITAAVHFSNGGGIYRGRSRATSEHGDGPGPEVILKEARPHAGLDGAGRDAVSRLEHEHGILRRLAGVAAVPSVGEPFTLAGHRFLPQQSVPGSTLNRWVARHYPLSAGDASPEEVRTYATRASALAQRVATALEEIHARGVAMIDLHPGNILVDEDDRIALIDFEVAGEVDAVVDVGMGAPGFGLPPERAGATGREADLYALAVLRLWLFHPTASVLSISRVPLAGWIDHVARRFALPSTWATDLRARLGVAPVASSSGSAPAGSASAVREDDTLARLCSGLVAGIHAAATPDRTDRLFPGDIRQFDVDGRCFGYGAAGVLHALRLAGDGPSPGYEQWLLESLDREPCGRTGFWEGAHGIAWALDGLGVTEAADRVLAGVADCHRPGSPDIGVRGGLAGAALVLLDLAERRHDDRLRRRGLAIAAELADLAEPTRGATGVAGLWDGWSGAALVHVRAYDVTADATWLERADRALRRDLDQCVDAAGGALHVADPDQPGTLPYVGRGSAGIALAAQALAARAPWMSSTEALPALLAACRAEFVAHAGFGQGAAGLLYALLPASSATPPSGAGGTEAVREAIARHVSALDRHVVPLGDGTGVAGHQLLRLSLDLETGNAGVLLALQSARTGDPGLPLPRLRCPTAALTP